MVIERAVARSQTARAADQAEDALFEAFAHSRSMMFGVARRIVGDDLSADVVQQVITRAWQSLDHYDPDRGSIRSYLLTLTRGIAIDVLRETSRRRDREIRNAAPQCSWSENDELEELIRDEHALRVSGALGCLNVNERHLITLAFYSGRTHRQIAIDLGIPLGTVKSRIRSALSKLRLVLDDLCEGAPSPKQAPARRRLEMVPPMHSSTTNGCVLAAEVA